MDFLRQLVRGLVEVWRQIHELNMHFLPANKKFRVSAALDPKDDPYREIETLRDIEGRYQFDFSVNVMNASKLAMQQALEKLGEFGAAYVYSHAGNIYYKTWQIYYL